MPSRPAFSIVSPRMDVPAAAGPVDDDSVVVLVAVEHRALAARVDGRVVPHEREALRHGHRLGIRSRADGDGVPGVRLTDGIADGAARRTRAVAGIRAGCRYEAGRLGSSERRAGRRHHDGDDPCEQKDLHSVPLSLDIYDLQTVTQTEGRALGSSARARARAVGEVMGPRSRSSRSRRGRWRARAGARWVCRRRRPTKRPRGCSA